MTPLLRQFLIEGRELIQEASDGLLALEHAPDDAEGVITVFRAFHTLKGGSGLFPLQPMTAMLHAAEEILAAVRGGRLALDRTTIDLLLAVLDKTGHWLDALESRGTLPEDADAIGSDLARILRGQLADSTGADAAPRSGLPAGNEDLPAWVRDLSEVERMAALDLSRSRGWTGPMVAIAYDPDPQCFFNGDDPVNLFRRLSDVAVLRIGRREPWPAAKDLDPFSCNLVFHCLALADLAEVRSLFRFINDQVRISEVMPDALAGPGGEPAEAVGGQDLAGAALSQSRARIRAEVVRAVLREQQRVLAESRPGAEFKGRLGSVARVMANVARGGRLEHETETLADAYRQALRMDSPAPLLDLLDRMLEEHEPIPDPLVPTRRGPAAETAGRPAQGGGGSRVLRVDEARIERLVALVGEMMVAKNGLAWLARRAGQEIGDAGLARQIRGVQASFDRLTRELHDAVIQVRMLPVGQIFQRFPRLVRDSARQLDKKVEFILRGEETEADKAVVEALFEPLLHLLRNALDHGIESPAERRDVGKPEQARLVLRASRESNQIVVEVTDDGRGIDPDAVRRKAVVQGLLDPEAAAALDDAESLRLIFAPGLTTAAAVSELSGRGVGMDTVRSAVEKAGGTVSVTSEPGRGTSVVLYLPISLAGLRIMIVTVGRHRFGIPLDAVAETVLVPRREIRRIKDQQAFVLRDRVVPLRRLDGLLGLPDDGEAERNGDARILVADADGMPIGIEVDGLGDRLDAILRPMEGLLADIPGYLGTTLLADGSVLLILDLKGLLR